MQQKEIDEMKKLLILTNRLSDWHVSHLQKWPYIVFNEEAKCKLNKLEVDYSFASSDKEDSYVTYIVDIPEMQAPDLKTRGAHLAQWTRSIFWPETKVTVKLSSGEIVYE